MNTPQQNSELRLRHERMILENKLNTKHAHNIFSNVIGKYRPPKVYVSPQQAKELSLIKARLELEKSNSKKISSALHQVSQDIAEPVKDARSFEERATDETYQQEIGLKNTMKLLEDQNEAQQLLKQLRENDLLAIFNSLFPKIYRDKKENYDDISAFEAFKEIKLLIANDSDKEKKQPISEKAFIKEIEKLIRIMDDKMRSRDNKHSSAYDSISDALLKIDAIRQTSQNVGSSNIVDVLGADAE